MAGTPHVSGTVVNSADLNDRAKIYDRSTGEVDVVNTTVLTALYSKSIGAGHMSTDRVLRCNVLGDLLQNGLATSGFTFQIAFGGTTLYQTTFVTEIAQRAARIPFSIQFMLANLGATNSQFLHGFVSVGEGAAAPTTGIGTVNQIVGSSTSYLEAFASSGTIAVDTTAAKTLSVSVQHENASTSISCRKRYAVLELL